MVSRKPFSASFTCANTRCTRRRTARKLVKRAKRVQIPCHRSVSAAVSAACAARWRRRCTILEPATLRRCLNSGQRMRSEPWIHFASMRSPAACSRACRRRCAACRQDLESNFRAVLRERPEQARPGEPRRVRRADAGARAHPLRGSKRSRRGSRRSKAARPPPATAGPGTRRLSARARKPSAPLVAVARVACRAQVGLTAPLVHVEVSLASGLPTFCIVGLAATVVKESKERVRAALMQLRLRISRRAHHGESRARGPAEGGRPLRSADRARDPAGFAVRCARRLAPRPDCVDALRVLRRTGSDRRTEAGRRSAAGGGPRARATATS